MNVNDIKKFIYLFKKYLCNMNKDTTDLQKHNSLLKNDSESQK